VTEHLIDLPRERHDVGANVARQKLAPDIHDAIEIVEKVEANTGTITNLPIVLINETVPPTAADTMLPMGESDSVTSDSAWPLTLCSAASTLGGTGTPCGSSQGRTYCTSDRTRAHAKAASLGSLGPVVARPTHGPGEAALGHFGPRDGCTRGALPRGWTM
jgi:hypothetical protein